MIKKYLVGLIIIGLITISGCVLEIEEEAQTLVDETKTINENYGYWYPFSLYQGIKLNIEVEVISGGSVDFILVDSQGLADYTYLLGGGIGEVEYFIDGSILNGKSLRSTFIVPEDGDYALIIDNSYIPDEGAEPEGSVDVKIKVIAE